ncbi:glycerol-3-phosphate dehydrogenase [Halopiger aswanensis]|uniref:Glycerol-3-phosphate dehydrogenase n=1 Tax=Halopiger aswanensis TaxID=148449 RepID=A0A419VZJ0_9EURY|nr:glycerol-3-phosphate dehydrogenase [Halopiger aswanensis]RKD88642.1 glycerol-3-phosphate dehydrogenase [Halopiger aswanensis]
MSDRETGFGQRRPDRTSIAGSYDLVIVGGGIAGAGVARDAAMRGIDTLLVEQADFGSGTTAGSTRLAHGGLRYLEQYDFSLVFESLQERETLAEIAPHLVDPLTFLIPQYDESRLARLKLRLGMILYDALSYGKSMPNHRYLSPEALQDLEPAIPTDGLQGGFAYHDRQIEFVERLCLENVIDAANHGATVLNHAAVTDLCVENGSVVGVRIDDELSGESIDVEGDAIINAAGPWIDDVLGGYADEQFVYPAKGIHLVVPKLTDHALTLPTTDDRIVFVVPWNGFSLVGTTDTEFDGDPADAAATDADVDYLLKEVGRYFPDLSKGDVLYSYAGVRPLYDSGSTGRASDVSREHRVIDHRDDISGLFSLVGVKITPYRHAAEEATDMVAEYLGVERSCRTATEPLPGGWGHRSSGGSLPQSVVEHLQKLYGSRADVVVDRAEHDERLAEPLCEHTYDVLAQVTVAVEEEYARRLTDVVFRRCTVGYESCQGLDAVETIADHMAELLEWDDRRKEAELEWYERVLERRTVNAEQGGLKRFDT